MHILLINQFFAPDPAPTGQLLADTARALIADGHTVSVVCSRTHYEAYDQVGDYGLEEVSVHRVGGLSFGASRLSRLASYGSFFLGALLRANFGKCPDIVVTLTTPPLLCLTVALIKRFRGVRHFIWEMDIYPDIAVAVGLFAPGRLLDRAVGALADFSRRRADGIITLGHCMKTRLAGRGIPLEKIDVAENWADGSIISPRPFPPVDPLVFLYSGNLGRAHDVDTLAEAMMVLEESDRMRFIFAGSGSRRATLAEACKGRRDVEFLPYQAHDDLPDHLGRCHVGLVTQIDRTCGAVVPSKTYTLMAAGRPFIFIGPAEATPARLIERFHCGWQVDPGDPISLMQLLGLLESNPELIQAAGKRAREAFLHSCDMPIGASRIVSILTRSGSVSGPAKSLSADA